MSQSNGTALATWANSPTEGPSASYPSWPASEDATQTDHTSELAAQVAEARHRVAYQGELQELWGEELSEDEFGDVAEKEREKRARRRQQDLERFKAQLADEDADFAVQRALSNRKNQSATARAKSTAKMQEWRQRAAHTAERLTSHDMRLAQLVRQLTWTRRMLILLMAVGMSWSAVNVQHNLVPSGDFSEPLYWTSYGVESLVSGCLIVLVMTSATLEAWGHHRASHRRSGYPLEVVLVLISLGLASGAPLANGDVRLALEYAVPPVMVGVLVWTYNYATSALSRVLAEQANADMRQRYAELVADGELLALAGRGVAAMTAGAVRPSNAEAGGGVPSASALAAELGVSKPRACQVRDAMKLLREVGDQQ